MQFDPHPVPPPLPPPGSVAWVPPQDEAPRPVLPLHPPPLPPSSPPSPPRPKGRGRWRAAILIVACLVLFVGTGAWFLRHRLFPGAAPRRVETAERKYRAVREAFASDGPKADVRTLSAMDTLLGQLGRALLRRQGPRAAALFDFERMAQEMQAHPAAARLPRISNRLYAASLQAEFARMFDSAQGMDGWSHHRLRHVDFLPGGGGDEALIYASHKLDDGTSLRYRWWVRRSGAAWRVYDYEELTGGMSATYRMAAAEAATAAGAGWPAVYERVDEALGAAGAGDFDAAERALRKGDGASFPAEFDAMRWNAWGIVHLGRARHAEALEALDKASAAAPGNPLADQLRSAVCLSMGDHAGALASARRYADTMGPDADNLHTIGLALEGLGRTREALTSYRAALDEDRDSIDNLVALGLALPPEGKQELGARWAGSAVTAARFREVAEGFVESDPAALRALLDAYAADVARSQYDPYLKYYEARWHAAAGRHDEAAAIARKALGTTDEEVRDAVYPVYFSSMRRAGRAVEAYRDERVPQADRGDAFLTLASGLAAAEDTDTLAKLIEVRRADAPGDPYAHYYEGRLRRLAGDFAAAERSYAAAAAGGLDEAWAETLRGARVEVRYRQGEGLPALGEIGPADRTFAQLARLYAEDKDADGLERLLSARAGARRPDASMPLWRAELMWLREDYGAAADQFLARYRATEAAAKAAESTNAADQAQRAEDGEHWDDWPVEQRIVYSLIRGGREAEALRFARGEKERYGTSYFLLIVHASAGRVTEAIEMFRACVGDGFDPAYLYDAETLGPVLRSDRFKALHAEFPPGEPPPAPTTPDADRPDGGASAGE
jgi:tetratricopeptide (TPR) repeat protein